MTTTPFPLGAYIGQPDNTSATNEAAYVAEYNNLTQLMGAAPQFLDYFIDQSQPVASWAGNAQWAATSAAASPARSATPVIALPLSSTASTLTADQQYKAFASGQYDSVIQNAVKVWAQQGFNTQYWRPGWEMNIPSMPSYAGTDAQTQGDWVAAFQHVYTVLHAAGAANGVNVQVVWNPDVTNYDTLGVLKNLYPGNNYVDVIGADIYADAYPYSDGTNAAGQATYHDWDTGAEDTSFQQWLADPVNRTHYWSNPAATKWALDGSSGHDLSLQTLLDFAKAQGKPFAVPETGAGNAAGGHDVSDDAAFPAWLAQTLQASGDAVKFVNLWDSNGGGNFEFSSATAGKPGEAAAWASSFGTASIGSGPDTLTLNLSEDAYNGDAQFTVSVDGVQVGGAQAVTASHAAGASQAFNVHGTFGTAGHTVGVTFLNDAWGGPGLDRNLYVNSLALNGTPVTNSSAALYNNGTASLAIPFSGVSSSPVTVSSGPDTIALKLSEDAYLGNAQFTVSVDGVQVGGTQTATASHAAGADQMFNVEGTFGTAAHTVGVTFLNDAWGGPGLDRNLYVDGMAYDGTTVANGTAALYSNGTAALAIPSSGATASDTLTVSMSEDAYAGNAQFLLTVDGRQVGGTLTATASHALGQTAAMTFTGSFGTGAHTVGVTFLNDAYSGPGLDRNLYIDAMTFDGKAVAGAASALYWNRTQTVAVPAANAANTAVPASQASAVNSIVPAS